MFTCPSFTRFTVSRITDIPIPIQNTAVWFGFTPTLTILATVDDCTMN